VTAPRALRVARGVSAGVLSGQLEQLGARPHPVRGHEQSGFGRELGMAALDGYTDLKNVFISTEG
jgi:acyl-CoA reductase-like NAD-dependent aldehyde dehydrogenase